MGATTTCSGCHKPLLANAPQGLCPECLLKAGLGTGVDLGPDTQSEPAGGSRGFVPPSPEELGRFFPQMEITRLLGRGGMGAVYRARQKQLDRVVALKILPPSVSQDPAFAERFAREARALARLNHANIVALYEFGEAGGMPYFVMEYVEGITLRRLVQARRLEPREALKIVPQICEALQFAHDEGVVHRDIKPENILLDKKGRVKIADFGIAKIVQGRDASPRRPGEDERTAGPPVPTNLTEAGRVLGTPNYMAPEQVEHPQTVDHRADIYSLGVVFYEMLTGELPLGKFQPPSKKVQVDVRLDEVVLHALEKEPELRYQHASQVKTALETIGASPELSSTRREEVQTEGLRPEAAKGSQSLASSTAKRSGRAIAWIALCVLSLGGVWGIAAFRSHSWPFKPTLKVLAPDKGTSFAGLPASGLPMVGGIFIDDVTVINNSKPVMSDDFNTGKLTAGWDARLPRVIVTPVAGNSTNHCLYMNRGNNVKAYARHSVQCDQVGALELKAKVFLPQPTEQWGYSHGKREHTAIGLTTGRDEHRLYVEIALNPGESAYHVELVHIKPEIKGPRGRIETFSSREPVLAPGKWALVSFKLDPSAGTATVYVDRQPQVSCPYDPSKITTLTDLFLTTVMGNLEPAVNPKARGLPKESPARMGNLEPAVNAAGEATAPAGSPAGSGQLRFKELLSRLSAASEDCIRGLSSIQCDYRLVGPDSSEEPPTGKKPPVKLAVAGKLTLHLPENRADRDDENPPGTFDMFRLELDAWPILKDALGESAAKDLKPFPMPGSKLVCSEAGSWLVSKDDKTAVRFKMDSAGQDEVFGSMIPTVCCHYEASMVKAFRADIRGAIGTKVNSDSLAGRKCAEYLFELPATGAGAPAGTYAVWLDDATGLPLKEELRGGIGAGGTTGVTYSDFQRFGKGSFSPARSDEKPDTREDVHCELQYSPFGTRWFLTKEVSLRSSEGVLCTMTFSNWRQVTVPDSAFELPPGAKIISSEDTPDKGSKGKK